MHVTHFIVSRSLWPCVVQTSHDDVIKWKHFPRYWPFVRRIHRSRMKSPHKGQWRGALMFSLICVQINGWVNNREVGDLRRHHAHYDVIIMLQKRSKTQHFISLQWPRCSIYILLVCELFKSIIYADVWSLWFSKHRHWHIGCKGLKKLLM